MSWDEIIYLLVLLFSLPAGYLVKNLPDPSIKRNVCTAFGTTAVVVLCEFQTVHSLFPVLTTFIIIKVIGWRKCHIWSFFFNFLYLTFFRAGSYFGLRGPTAFSNVVQLLLTLKLVGIAFEYHDSEKFKADSAKGVPHPISRDGRKKYIPLIAEPSLLDIFHYSYCFIGIMTGPYFKYKTYCDMINNSDSANIPTFKPMLQRIKEMIPLGALFLLLSRYINAKYMTEDPFFEEPFWKRLFYTFPAFTIFRLRFYCAWKLAESVCIASTLGAYPTYLRSKCGQGPSIDPAEIKSSENVPIQYDFETIYNINVYQTEFTSTFRDALRSWNTTVQWWLKNFVFIRFPVKSLSTMVTMFISAYWHGIHAGYYMSLLTVPFLLYGEDLMIRGYRTEQNKTTYDWVNCILRMRGFEYLSLGFLVVYGRAVWNYWVSVYFIGHIVIGMFIVIGTLRLQALKRVRTVPEVQGNVQGGQ